jgi:HAD superfamily hydrolase (TIGR01509 family)
MLSDTVRTAPAERLRVDAVLLDLDGTLVTSNDAHAKAWADVLAEAGIPRAFGDIRALIGMGSGPLLAKLCGIPEDDPASERIAARRGEIFRERYLGEVQAQPGAGELIVKLVDRGFRVVLATASSEEDVRAIVKAAGLQDVIPEWTTADDVKRAKPAPDVICAAVEKAGANAHHTVLIGDTPYDLEAARAAGAHVIALRCGGWNDDALDGAIEVFNDPADLLRNWMQTPFRASLADLALPL